MENNELTTDPGQELIVPAVSAAVEGMVSGAPAELVKGYAERTALRVLVKQLVGGSITVLGLGELFDITKALATEGIDVGAFLLKPMPSDQITEWARKNGLDPNGRLSDDQMRALIPYIGLVDDNAARDVEAEIAKRAGGQREGVGNMKKATGSPYASTKVATQGGGGDELRGLIEPARTLTAIVGVSPKRLPELMKSLRAMLSATEEEIEELAALAGWNQ